MRLHAQLIRDADKLDNCRVKLVESVELLLGLSAEEVGRQKISDKVWQACLERRSVYSPDRVTRMDYWVSYVAYLFDLFFVSSRKIVMEKDFVDRTIDRIPYSDPDTKEKMEELREMVKEALAGEAKIEEKS